MKKLKRVVIVGAGSMAREHVRVFAAQPDVKIVGIYSRTRSKAQVLSVEFGIPFIANSVSELYNKAEPDLVVVAINILGAKEVLKQCIEFGVPILTEKPIALNLEASMEVQRFAHEKGCDVWVGLNRRFYSATRAVFDGLKDNNEQRVIQVWDQQDLGVAKKLGHPMDVQNNWMYANSIHLVDYLCMFGRGNVVSVDVVNRFDIAHPSLVSACVRFSSGDVGLYTAVWNAPGPWGCVVTTPSVRWEMLPLEAARSVKRGSRIAEEIDSDELDRNFKPGFFCQARSVLNALDAPGCDGACNIDQAIVTTALVNQIYSV